MGSAFLHGAEDRQRNRWVLLVTFLQVTNRQLMHIYSVEAAGYRLLQDGQGIFYGRRRPANNRCVLFATFLQVSRIRSRWNPGRRYGCRNCTSSCCTRRSATRRHLRMALKTGIPKNRYVVAPPTFVHV